MARSTVTYWSPLGSESRDRWMPVDGMGECRAELTLAIDQETSDYAKLTRFRAGADTAPFGPRGDCYPEEILIFEGRR